MSEQLRIADIKDITEEMKGEILGELRKETSSINEMIKEGKSEIIAVIFSESRIIRQEIGYQTIMLKILEDNLSEIQFDEGTGISSYRFSRSKASSLLSGSFLTSLFI